LHSGLDTASILSTGRSVWRRLAILMSASLFSPSGNFCADESRWPPLAENVGETKWDVFMNSELELLTGGCLCGAVAYEVRSPFLRFAHCHCGRCRKATGAGHATNLYCAPERFAWLTREDLVARYELPSARSFATVFCCRCGSPLPHRTRSGREIVVPAGSLYKQPNQKPQARIFWGSRVNWSCDGDDLPRFAELPEWWR